MTKETIKVGNTAEAYLTLLAERGVDYLFANAGTDFAPIIEAYAAAAGSGKKLPQPITVPHENAAVAMAHGYTMVTGRPQAVMTHVSVGTANALNGVFNAARARIPILMTAGRTPLTEGNDLLGARDFTIHWAQEMFDQGGIMRELVKWDYELRNSVQLEAVVDRALEIATTEPQGPIYLSLPREVLAEPLESFTYSKNPRRDHALPTAPNQAALERAADLLANAENPLIITSASGRHLANVTALADLAETYGIGVIEYSPKYMCLATNHPMHLGFQPKPHLMNADVVLVIDCDVPWSLGNEDPPSDGTVIHIGVDPIYPRYPIQSFPRDLTINADSRVALPLLSQALAQATKNKKPAIDARRATVKAAHDALFAEWKALPDRVKDLTPIHPVWFSHCVQQVRGKNSIIVNEYPFIGGQMEYNEPGSYFGVSSAGGLGWGFGAALGAKLAAPDKLVIAGLGDGAYMFCNPTPCHYVSQAENLPILTVVNNNQRWHAVYGATASMYPDGAAVKANQVPLTELRPSPNFELVARASGAHAEKVEDPSKLIPALEKAIDVIETEKRQAMLNVITQYVVRR